MGEKTAISWTDHTWNPWRGCTPVSPGCAHCYAQRDMTRRGFDFSAVTRTKTWGNPLRWQAEAQAAGIQERVFTCSWSDWFHPAADAWRTEAWEIVRRCPNLIFQILTKRPELIYDTQSQYASAMDEAEKLFPDDEGEQIEYSERESLNFTALRLPPDWGAGYPNVWLGVSVENPAFLRRMDLLRYIPAAIRFVSAEPLLAPLGPLNLAGFHWVIVGGESGPDFRPMDHAWARDIRDQCQRENVAFFFKQSAGFRPATDDWLDDRRWREFPRGGECLGADR